MQSLNDIKQQHIDTISSSKKLSDVFKTSMIDYIIQSCDEISTLQYKNVNIRLIGSEYEYDIIVIDIDYNDILSILIVRAFDEEDIQIPHDPLVTLMENDKIIFQNRISVNTLVKSIVNV